MSFLEKQRREGMDERADRTKKIYKILRQGKSKFLR